MESQEEGRVEERRRGERREEGEWIIVNYPLFINRYLSVNYSRYWHADFCIRSVSSIRFEWYLESYNQMIDSCDTVDRLKVIDVKFDVRNTLWHEISIAKYRVLRNDWLTANKNMNILWNWKVMNILLLRTLGLSILFIKCPQTLSKSKWFNRNNLKRPNRDFQYKCQKFGHFILKMH